jgi:ParB family transcriptional regulator, chromosome partitioning protein
VPPRKKKPASASVGLAATEVAEGKPPREVQALAEQVTDDGGAVLATYREPFDGRWILLVSIPLDKIEPTPYQRELSETHVTRLAGVIPKIGRFLDPVIAVRQGDGYWTPNGMHRLMALRRLGGKSIVALLVPEEEIAYRILALNTERAHNLKDKALEVVRMARGLAEIPSAAKRPESDWAFEFEEASYLTIGLCYEERARFSGGAYMPIVKRCEEFSDRPIGKSLALRGPRAEKLLELDDAIVDVVKRLKEAGFTSAYLKPFVIARCNPLRSQKAARVGAKAPRADFDETIDKMLAVAKKFDVSKVRPQDLAAAAAMGPPPDESA